MRRGLLVGVLALGLLGAATAAARWWAGEEITRQLLRRDARWDQRSDRFTSIRIDGLALPGVEVETAQVDLVAGRVALAGVDVDARALLAAEAPVAEGAPASSGPSVPLRAEDLTLRWGETVLAEGLSGSLRPEVELEGPGLRLVRRGESTEARLTREVELPVLSGEATAEITCTGRDCAGELRMDEAVLDHPLLAPAPLPPQRLLATLSTASGEDGSLQLTGTVSLGLVEAAVELGWEDGIATVELSTENTPLEDVVALFGPLVPEASAAILGGTVGLDATYRWPDGAWSARPRAAGLRAEAVLPPVDLRGGPFAWSAPTASGETALRRSGDGVHGWVPLREAGLFPDAAIAAEDSAFARHPGYDLEAMQAALDRMSAEPDGLLRGGSTLTQQLAKNLFLDSADRTLLRKLRELLFALELESTLPKRRILELYVNVVELGPGLIGVGEAADAYFLKRPARLAPREAAFLASVLPAPRSRGARAWRGGRAPDARIDGILQNMVNGGALSADAAAAARRAPLRFVPP